MFFKSKNDGNPPTETEQANKILLLMFAALALLIFMDNQARRHYRNLGVTKISGKKAGKKAVKVSKRKINEIRERVLPPMKRSARDIFGGVSRARSMLHEPAIPSPRSRRDLNPFPRNPDSRASTTRPLGPRGMELYFIRFRGGRSVLTRVKRNVPARDYSPMGALRILQKGALPEERGLMTVLTRSSLVLDVNIENGTALVELGSGFPRVAPRLIRDRIDQVKYTLLQFPDIKRVRFSLQGREVDELRGVPVEPARPRRVLNYRP